MSRMSERAWDTYAVVAVVFQIMLIAGGLIYLVLNGSGSSGSCDSPWFGC